MALSTFVKVSGINNLSDARYCAGMGVNVLGFNIDAQDENHVKADTFKELADWVSGVDFAAEIHQSILSHDQMAQLKSEYQFQYIEISSQQNLDFIISNHSDLKVIYKIYIDQLGSNELKEMIENHQKSVSYFLLDTNDESSYDKKKLDEILEFTAQYQILIGFHITENNVHRIINEGASGICLKGGQEIRPGFKNFDELADILEAIEVDDYA